MSKCISACRILSRYIATLSIIFIISPPANQLYRWSRNSRRAKALFSGSVTLHIAKIAKIYLTKCHRKRNVLRHSTRSWPGNGRHVWHIFLLWPLGWADFFSEKFFFLSEHRDMVKVNEWENPQIKGILLIFEVAFFQQWRWHLAPGIISALFLSHYFLLCTNASGQKPYFAYFRCVMNIMRVQHHASD